MPAALVAFGGEHAFARMRKHVAWYIADMPGATYVRARAYACKSSAELDELLAEYREFLKRACPGIPSDEPVDVPAPEASAR